MGFDYQATFSLIEWLALTGLAQSLLILVYIIFRVRNWRQASVALAYFTFLAFAFGLQFALRLDDYENYIRLGLGFARAMGAPLCYLLVLQVSRPQIMPQPRQFLILLLVPLALCLGLVTAHFQKVCDDGVMLCARSFSIVGWFSAMAGACCMLAIWFQKNIFTILWGEKGGRERYWLVITLIVANVLRTAVSLLTATGHVARPDSDALQVMLGIAFAYLVMTTLFRIYPLPVQLHTSSRARLLLLTDEEKDIAEKVRKLMELDKVYHEPSFSRADLAKEVGTSENTLSRVINQAFGKSFPKLLNEFRVEDAKRMLHNPAIAINVLAFEVGFNSLASFNRVFREVTGETPSHYRSRHQGPDSGEA